jgi:hypothetical protein
MRCIECGRQIVLLNAIEDWTKPVLGFEHETHMRMDAVKPNSALPSTNRSKKNTKSKIAAILTTPSIASSAAVR